MEVVPFAALCAVILVKEAGVPIPVPGDLLVIGAGVSTSGRPEALVWLAGILVAGYVGGCVQFVLVRGPARRPILGLLGRLGLDEGRLERVAAPLCRQGARAVAVARATPGVRVPVIAASAVAALPMGVFVRGLVAGNTLFVGGHFALGFVVGAPAERVGAALASPAVLGVVVVALAVLGAIGWLAIRRREASADLVAAWADAACPICLGLAVMERHAPGIVDPAVQG
jgi:membrane protein DedA with SNARE-associated domain